MGFLMRASGYTYTYNMNELLAQPLPVYRAIQGSLTTIQDELYSYKCIIACILDFKTCSHYETQQLLLAFRIC